MSRRRLLFGALAFILAMVVAVVRPGEEPETQLVTTATTTTTTQSASTLMTLPAPLAPNYDPSKGVTNIHRRPTLEEVCAGPELRRALEESTSRQEILPMPCSPITTTRPR